MRAIKLNKEAIHLVGLLIKNLQTDHEDFDKIWYAHSDKWKESAPGKAADDWLDYLETFIRTLKEFPAEPETDMYRTAGPVVEWQTVGDDGTIKPWPSLLEAKAYVARQKTQRGRTTTVQQRQITPWKEA